MKRSLLIVTIVFALARPAFADQCIDAAAARYSVDPDVLRAIEMIESSQNNKAVNRSNQNGSYDVCAMQINSVHFSRLAKWNITEDELLNNRCLCIQTGAFLLAENIAQVGPSWAAVGYYHTGLNGNTKRARAYALKVKQYYTRIHNRKVANTLK